MRNPATDPQASDVMVNHKTACKLTVISRVGRRLTVMRGQSDEWDYMLLEQWQAWARDAIPFVNADVEELFPLKLQTPKQGFRH